MKFQEGKFLIKLQKQDIVNKNVQILTPWKKNDFIFIYRIAYFAFILKSCYSRSSGVVFGKYIHI